MTRTDPSTYYTPAAVLALIEPRMSSGLFLGEIASHPASSSACPIRLGGDGDSLHLGSGRADEGAGWDPHPVGSVGQGWTPARVDDASTPSGPDVFLAPPCGDRAGGRGFARPPGQGRRDAMIAALAGVLLVCASAAGWVLLLLVATDVVRQHRTAKAWRPDPPRREDLP